MTEIVAQTYSHLIRDYGREGRFLDFGSGQVPLYGMYRHLASAATCIDWGKSDHNLWHVDIETDLNGHLPLPASSFDTVIATDVLEHLWNPEFAFREISRVLIPGGRLLVGVPFFYWLHEEPHDYHRYTQHQLRVLCHNAHLDVLYLEPYGGPVEVLWDLIGKQLGSWSGRWHARVGRLLKELRVRGREPRRFPLGYGLAAEKRAQRPAQPPG